MRSLFRILFELLIHYYQRPAAGRFVRPDVVPIPVTVRHTRATDYPGNTSDWK